MGMDELHAKLTEAARAVLAENGASAPDRDTDTLAGLIATAVIQAAKEHAAATADPEDELAGAETPTDTATGTEGQAGDTAAGGESTPGEKPAEAGHDVADGKPDTEPTTPA